MPTTWSQNSFIYSRVATACENELHYCTEQPSTFEVAHDNVMETFDRYCTPRVSTTILKASHRRPKSVMRPPRKSIWKKAPRWW